MTLRKIASLLLIALDVVIPKGAESKPFRKVLILSGGELRFSAASRCWPHFIRGDGFPM